MKFKLTLLALGCVTISGCTSTTHGTINQPLNQQSTQTSSVIAQAVEKSLKRVVAIGRFSDETKRGNSFLLDQSNNRIGKQASDILTSRLNDSGKFLMLERADIDALKTENELNGEKLAVVGADYLIVGSVSEYGRTNTSEVGVFSRNRIQKANVTVNVRLVNTKTSQIVFSQEASGEAVTESNHVLGVGERAGYNTALDDKALSAAISKLVSNIMENLLDAPWQAYLLSSEDNQFFMSGGKAQGIKLTDRFAVLAKGKLVKNPQTGQMIELPGKQVATIKVAGFVGSGENALSVTELASGDIDIAKLNQYVVREL